MHEQTPWTNNNKVNTKTRILVILLKRKGTRYFAKKALTISVLGGVVSFSETQKAISYLFCWILLTSMLRQAMNMVICRMKSMMTAIPATKQKLQRAGTSVSIPMKKARASQKAAQNIEGPISFRAYAILNSTDLMYGGTYLSALEIKNMLSTPIARTRKGTTSAEIMVRGTPP